MKFGENFPMKFDQKFDSKFVMKFYHEFVTKFDQKFVKKCYLNSQKYKKDFLFIIKKIKIAFIFFQL